MRGYTFTGMIIGFPERHTFVREGRSAPLSMFPANVVLHSLRTSEIEYLIRIRITDGNATVTQADTTMGTWDASFGTQDETSSVLISSHTLSQGETEIPMIQVHIMNDIKMETNETLGLRMFVPGVGRQTVECYDDGEIPVEGNFFCSNTITIVDDDGQFQIYIQCTILFLCPVSTPIVTVVFGTAIPTSLYIFGNVFFIYCLCHFLLYNSTPYRRVLF